MRRKRTKSFKGKVSCHVLSFRRSFSARKWVDSGIESGRKKAYGISNVSRSRDLPFPYPEDLVIALPRMALYIRKNMEINNIYKKYTDEQNHAVYSIDESFVDVTDSLCKGRKRAGENVSIETDELANVRV